MKIAVAIDGPAAAGKSTIAKKVALMRGFTYIDAMWETRVHSLGWEDPLEKGKATHPSLWRRKVRHN